MISTSQGCVRRLNRWFVYEIRIYIHTHTHIYTYIYIYKEKYGERD